MPYGDTTLYEQKILMLKINISYIINKFYLRNEYYLIVKE